MVEKPDSVGDGSLEGGAMKQTAPRRHNVSSKKHIERSCESDVALEPRERLPHLRDDLNALDMRGP